MPKLSNATHVAIERAFGAQALLTMGGTSFLQLPHAGAELVHGLARVIRSVPSFYLHLTPDRAQIAPAIDRLLDELRSRPGV